MTLLLHPKPYPKFSYDDRKEKFLAGRAEAQTLLLANADYIYPFIDYIAAIDESRGTIPQSVAYFAQVLLKAVHGVDAYKSVKDLKNGLALLAEAVNSAQTTAPDYNLFADELDTVRALVLSSLQLQPPSVRKDLELESFQRGFPAFKYLALRLVSSGNFQGFARDSLKKIIRDSRSAQAAAMLVLASRRAA